MTKPSTVNELFNYFLDLPAIILIIENFGCYCYQNYSNNFFLNTFSLNYYTEMTCPNKLNVNDIFHFDYVKLIEFLLRDTSIEQEYDSGSIYNYFNRRVKILFDTLVFTSRVHSSTKIVPKLMEKVF